MKTSTRRRSASAPRRIRTILHATDLSSRSDRAFTRAVELARRLRAKLAIVHVVDGELPTSLIAQFRDKAAQAIQDQIRSLPGAKALVPEIRIEPGDPYENILRCAKKIDADLIVMGLHRRRPLADLFIGTTVERVARLGRRPVLVVRDQVRGPYRRVMAAVDFSDCSKNAVALAQRIAADAAFQLVHGYHTPFVGLLGSKADRVKEKEAHERGLAQLLEQQMQVSSGAHTKGRFLKPLLEEGAVPDVILGGARRGGAELLVLGTHGRSVVAHSLLGSIATSFLNDPPCDVLAVPVR
jgi:nucleotide-binding universal stress UspA family protein